MRNVLLLPLLTALLLGTNSFGANQLEIKKYIEKAEKTYSLPPNLLYAVIEQESSFITNAKLDNSHGLGQITTGTGRSFCSLKKKELYDYKKNINCSASYVRYQLDRYHNNIYLALAAYNSGTPFVCNGKVYKRDLGWRVERMGPCKKKGSVLNTGYVYGVMSKWRNKNKKV